MTTEERLRAFRATVAAIRRERAEDERERRERERAAEDERRGWYAPDPGLIRENRGRVDYHYEEVQ